MTFNLNDLYNVQGFRYLARQDGGVNGTIRQYEFYTSADNATWSLAASGIWASDMTRKEVTFAAR